MSRDPYYPRLPEPRKNVIKLKVTVDPGSVDSRLPSARQEKWTNSQKLIFAGIVLFLLSWATFLIQP